MYICTQIHVMLLNIMCMYEKTSVSYCSEYIFARATLLALIQTFEFCVRDICKCCVISVPVAVARTVL
jgi:hypothetical protein